MTEFSLDGKVALVTGASRGIGRAIALKLATVGAKVVVSSRKIESLQTVADEIEAAGGKSLAIQANVGSQEDVIALVDKTVEVFGGVDVAVNNSATNPYFGPVLAAEEAQWDKIFDVNTKGVFRVCKAVAPIMEARGGGKIINMASLAGLKPAPAMGVYSASKAALIMLTKVLALELGRVNINVNAIAPGLIRTRMSQALWQTPEIAEPVLKSMPLGRFGEPNDVAGLALYLASSASDYVTGSIFILDGGMNVAAPV